MRGILRRLITNHKDVCEGDKICKICGRKGCANCISYATNITHGGKCVICAGLYTEDEINLYDKPDKIWDSEENNG